MFREMRRKDRELETEESLEILKKCNYGILSITSSDGYPYGVPLSYVFFEGAIYFHCAQEGQKLEAIRRDDKVSFCVVSEAIPLPEKFSMKYESVIVFGRATEVFGEDKNKILMEILKKYSPGYLDNGQKYINSDGMKTSVVKITIEQITGKARR